MKRLLMSGAVLALAVASAGVAQSSSRPDIIRADLPGAQVFERQCAPCHGTGPGDDGSPTLPGTAALERRYAGARPGPLELREDLTAPALTLFVRRGIGAMPAFRRGELTDQQIADIADYLQATARANR